MDLLTILIVILVIAALFGGPWWPHSRGWGYGPISILVVIILIVLLVRLLGVAT